MRSKENVGLQITINKKLLEIMDAAIAKLNEEHPDDPKITRSNIIHDCLITVLLGEVIIKKTEKKEA